MKQEVWSKLLLSLIIGSLFCSYLVSESTPTTNIVFTVGPYTQNTTNNSITILWETSTPTRCNIVEYGENTNYSYRVIGESNTKHHEITIYPSFSSGYYRVISDNLVSRNLRFKLATSNSFRCIIFGDSRGVWDNWLHAKRVADAINLEQPDIVIHGGDMVKNGWDNQQWMTWLNLMKPLMQNTTLFTVIGNHEGNSNRYYELFSLPGNEKWYSFDYGNCHFIILDNYEPYNEHSDQYGWLKEDLESTSKPFKIVCMHEPLYCKGGHKPRVDIREVWEPLFIEYNVNLVFQSHNHYYQRSNPINGVIYIVTGGGGAPLYNPEDASFINTSVKNYHYCVLDVSNDTINYSARYLNGTIFDELIIKPIYARITKPRNALYILDKEIMVLSFPIIIGGITIETTSSNIDEVEFYIDNQLASIDQEEPYNWYWSNPLPGWHKIKIVAYRNNDKIKVEKQVFVI